MLNAGFSTTYPAEIKAASARITTVYPVHKNIQFPPAD